jgi:O-antigen ligase
VGRFNNPSKASSSRDLAVPLSTWKETAVAGSGQITAPGTPGTNPIQTAVKSVPISSSVLTTIGFVLYCTYLLSGYANDWAIRLVGDKAYLSTVTVVLLPLVWLSCGNPLRGLRSGMGIWWALFLLWLILATPFSVWKGGSTRLLLNYIPRFYVCFFYIISFVTTVRRCRNLMYVNIAAAVIVVLTCITFGTSGDPGSDLDDTRFRVPQSLFFANANQLALNLLLGVTFFVFLFYRPGLGQHVLATAGILFSTIYALKTGSRGFLVAAIATLALMLVVNRAKLKLAALALLIFGVAALTLPSDMLHRLFLVTTDSNLTRLKTRADVASLQSQFQRQELLKQSLYYTWTHPLFGVGPDQFAVAVNGDAIEAGQRAPWLGTHNTYTQISSECGLPALFFYCAVIFLCFRLNYRLYKQSRDRAALKEVAGLSFCLLAGTMVYAVSTFFFHMAYSEILPMLSGFTVALNFAARNEFPSELGSLTRS